MDHSGHTELLAKPQVTPAERQDGVLTHEEVETRFNDLMSRGFTGFAFSDEGGQGTMIRKFDPNAAEILVAPQFAGG